MAELVVDGPPSEPSLDELLAVPVVTAAVHASPAREAAGTVHVLTAETIRRRGWRYLGELLADLPEVDVDNAVDPDAFDRVTVRGVPGNEKLLVVLDGVRLGPPDGAPWPLAEAYPLAGLRQVEVVLGPAAAVWAPDGFSGVVHLVSERGATLRGVRASGSIGSFGERSLAGVAGVRAGGVDLTATASLFHTEGAYLPDAYPEAFAWYGDHYVPDGLMLVSPTSQEGVETTIRPWSNGRDAWSFHGRAETAGFTLGFVAQGEHHPSATGLRPEYALYTDGARLGGSVRTVYAGYETTFRDDRVRWVSSADATEYRIDPRSAVLDASTGYAPGFVYGGTVAARGESRMTWQVARGFAASAGARFEATRSLARTLPAAQPWDPDVPTGAQEGVVLGTEGGYAIPAEVYESGADRVGVFGQAEVRPTEALALLAGLRVDGPWIGAPVVNPHAAVVLHPVPASTLKFVYGEATLEPSAFAAWGQAGSFRPVRDGEGEVVGLDGGVWRVPAGTLGATKLRSYSVDGSAPVWGVLVVGGDAWVSRIDGLVVTTTSEGGAVGGWPVDAVESATNAPRGWSWGGTARADARFVAGAWSVVPSAAFTGQGGELGGDPLAFVAPYTVKGGVDVAWGQLSLSARAIHRGPVLHPDAARGLDADAVAPPSTTVDLHTRWAPGLPGGRFGGAVTLDVANLLDARRYAAGADTAEAFRVAPQDPRTIRVGLEMKL